MTMHSLILRERMSIGFKGWDLGVEQGEIVLGAGAGCRERDGAESAGADFAGAVEPAEILAQALADALAERFGFLDESADERAIRLGEHGDEFLERAGSRLFGGPGELELDAFALVLNGEK